MNYCVFDCLNTIKTAPRFDISVSLKFVTTGSGNRNIHDFTIRREEYERNESETQQCVNVFTLKKQNETKQNKETLVNRNTA